MDGGGQLWNYAAGITTLFVIAVVLNNSHGVANMLTALGNLYGDAVGSPHVPLPYPKG